VHPQYFPGAPAPRLASPDAHTPLLALVSCEAMIGHVLACPTGHADNLIEPADALPALDFTLDQFPAAGLAQVRPAVHR
jgi:hypothetical protein